MSGLLEKLLKKNEKTTAKTEADEQKKYVRPDFVKQYVLTNPNLLFMDYRYFFDCDEIPVAYEQETRTGFQTCVQLPNNKFIREYLLQLYAAKNEVLQDSKTRTISVIQIAPNDYLYILPDLKHMKNPVMLVGFKKEPHYSWVLNVNPEINRAIVEQLKTFTR